MIKYLRKTPWHFWMATIILVFSTALATWVFFHTSERDTQELKEKATKFVRFKHRCDNITVDEVDRESGADGMVRFTVCGEKRWVYCKRKLCREIHRDKPLDIAK